MKSTVPVFCVHTKLVALEEVIPNPRNPNKHPDSQIALLSKIIKSQGWRSPIVISKRSGFVVKGHGRLLAAKLLNAECVPVDYQEYANEASEFADMIADNRIAELAEMEGPELKDLLQELDNGDMDMELTGYDEGELERLMTQFGSGEDLKDADPQMDKGEELRSKWNVSLGQIWELGDHRLLCGDCTVKANVERLVGKDRAEMMFTDPPYGVEYVGKTKDALTIENDGSAGLPLLLDGAFACAMSSIREGGAWYVAAPSGPPHWEFAKRLMDLGVYRQALVWVKDSMVLGHSDYHYKHEPIFYGWTPGAAHRVPVDRSQVSVWEIPRPKRSEEHPTMKPVELVAKAVGNSSLSGQVVYEPFSGSGTTIIACENLGRKCRAIEISPAYVAVAIQRWVDVTGKEPKLLNE